MADAMLTELYKRAFETQREAEDLACADGEMNDRRRQDALAKNELLVKLIDIRTYQISGIVSL